MQALISVERKLAALEDWLLMVLVAIIALILGAGVVFRYVFNDPLTWSEEFVVTLFVVRDAGRSLCFARTHAHSH